MRLIDALPWLVISILIIQPGLSAPVSIFVSDQQKEPIGYANVRVTLADGSPWDGGLTDVYGIFQTFLDENESYSISAEKNGIYGKGKWKGALGGERVIPITLKIPAKSLF